MKKTQNAGVILFGSSLLSMFLFVSCSDYNHGYGLSSTPTNESSNRPIDYPAQSFVSWEVAGDGIRYYLQVNPGKFKQYRYIRALKPALHGVKAGDIIVSGDDVKRFYSAQLRNGSEFDWGSEASYARLSDSITPWDNLPRKTVRYPLGQAARAVQIEGDAAGATHSKLDGTYFAIDLAAPLGTPVYSASTGVVTGAYGKFRDNAIGKRETDISKANFISILSSDGLEMIYAHLQENSVSVSVGQSINVGQEIAAVGNSGGSHFPHLHLSVGGINKHGYITFPLLFSCEQGQVFQPKLGMIGC